MIWANLLVPVLAIALLVTFFRKKIAPWEYAAIFLIPLIAIFIAKSCSVYSQTKAEEFWNAYITKAVYEEPWTTWDFKTCYRCISHDKNGNCTSRFPYDCSECDRYSSRVEAYDNLGRSHSISKEYFDQLSTIWNNKTMVELNHSVIRHSGCGQDGERFVTEFDGQFDHIQPYCDVHTYENKVKCTSTFDFQDISSQQAAKEGLFEYYHDFDHYNYNPIFGVTDPIATSRLQKWNALLGANKKVHMLVLVFKNKPYATAVRQESYWKGGNKNEFILCIGVDDTNKISWTKIISWTERDKLKTDLQKAVGSMSFNLPAIVDTTASYVKAQFFKKSFKDFKYIKIQPTKRATIICFIIVLLLTAGLCVFSIMNDYNLKD